MEKYIHPFIIRHIDDRSGLSKTVKVDKSSLTRPDAVMTVKQIMQSNLINTGVSPLHQQYNDTGVNLDLMDNLQREMYLRAVNSQMSAEKKAAEAAEAQALAEKQSAAAQAQIDAAVKAALSKQSEASADAK